MSTLLLLVIAEVIYHMDIGHAELSYAHMKLTTGTRDFGKWILWN